MSFVLATIGPPSGAVWRCTTSPVCLAEPGRGMAEAPLIPAMTPRGKPSGFSEWVSKTDFDSYLRCPYVFLLVHTGQIKGYTGDSEGSCQ